MSILLGAISISGDEIVLPSWYGKAGKDEETSSQGEFMPYSQAERGRQRAHPVFAFSRWLLAQNNPYVRVAYLEVAFSVSLQSQGFKTQIKTEELFQTKGN